MFEICFSKNNPKSMVVATSTETSLKELVQKILQVKPDLEHISLRNVTFPTPQKLSDLRNLPPELFKQLKKLKGLKLCGCNLTWSLDVLGELTELVWLDISSNNLTGTPETLKKLTKLEYLNLSRNEFTGAGADLIDWFGEMGSMRVLLSGKNFSAA